MWRPIFTRMADLAMRNWERWRGRLVSPATPGAAARATITVSTESMPSGFWLLKAASETELSAASPGTQIIQRTREQMYRCRAVGELARGAGVSNAIVTANIASGTNGENQYLLVVVPTKWLAEAPRRERLCSV